MECIVVVDAAEAVAAVADTIPKAGAAHPYLGLEAGAVVHKEAVVRTE